jgi:hypothetical protein
VKTSIPEDEVSLEVAEATELVAELQQKRSEKKAAAWINKKLIGTLVQPFRRPDRKKERLRRQLEVLNKSGLFDEEWYLSTYPDVATAGSRPH